jgi:pilus assembly protein Flp/PilA
MTRFAKMIRAFAHEEDGVALSEYLMLLALLIGGVLLFITTAGTNLGEAWNSWAGWFNKLAYS